MWLGHAGCARCGAAFTWRKRIGLHHSCHRRKDLQELNSGRWSLFCLFVCFKPQICLRWFYLTVFFLFCCCGYFLWYVYGCLGDMSVSTPHLCLVSIFFFRKKLSAETRVLEIIFTLRIYEVLVINNLTTNVINKNLLHIKDLYFIWALLALDHWETGWVPWDSQKVTYS